MAPVLLQRSFLGQEDCDVGDKRNSIAIFGLGYVGLPLSLCFAMKGCNVCGVDVSPKLVEEINSGITHHTESLGAVSIRRILKEQLANGRFIATTDAASIPDGCDNFIVTVGIPVSGGNHDPSALISCCKSIGGLLKNGDLVIIRSTVIPGFTEEHILTVLESESGLKAGRDFFLAYSSERIAEGSAFDEFMHMPTVVGGIDERSLERAAAVLSLVCEAEIVKAGSIKTVEVAKVIENVQRDVNIAMVQEFARFTEKLGVDIYDVIRVANTHKRVNLLYPGPGVGGYCIPNAYYYLKPKAEELGVDLGILKLSRMKNASMPETIASMIEDRFARSGEGISGKTIAVLGIAMKDYSNDDRISPPIEIIGCLQGKGAKVRSYDPVVTAEYPFKCRTVEETVDGADALAILARQAETDGLNAEFFVPRLKKGAFVFDTRNMFSAEKGKFLSNGIGYFSL